MSPDAPQEDPQEKRERERERRLARAERARTAQDNADSLTSDLRGVYGISNAPPARGGGRVFRNPRTGANLFTLNN